MSSAKERLRSAHAQKGLEPESIKQEEPIIEATNKEPDHKESTKEISQMAQEIASEDFVDLEEKPVKRREFESEKVKNKKRPVSITNIAREDVPLSTYAYKPVQVNFGCANMEVWDWLDHFSKTNQKYDGVAISKSQLVEIVLDIVYYDLELNPIGYESHKELREDIMDKIKRFGE